MICKAARNPCRRTGKRLALKITHSAFRRIKISENDFVVFSPYIVLSFTDKKYLELSQSGLYMTDLYDFYILNDRNSEYVLIRLKGHIVADDIISATHRIRVLPGYRSGMSEIWDASEADLSDMDDNSIRDLSNQLLKLWENGEAGKIAIVSEKEINKGLILLFIEYYNAGRFEVQTFESMLDATQWVI